MKYNVVYRSGRELVVSGEFMLRHLDGRELPFVDLDCAQKVGDENINAGAALCLDPRAVVKDSFGVVVYQGPKEMPAAWMRRAQ